MLPRCRVPHVLGAAGSFPAGSERLGQNVLERRACGQPLAVFRRQVLQFLVAQRQHLGFQFVDLGQERAGDDRVLVGRILGANQTELADEALIAGAEKLGQDADTLLGE